MSPPVPVYNSSNETLFYPNGQLVVFSGKNNFYLPVSKAVVIFFLCECAIVFDNLHLNKYLPTWLCFFYLLSVCLVFNLQLHSGPDLMLGVPEDKL